MAFDNSIEKSGAANRRRESKPYRYQYVPYDKGRAPCDETLPYDHYRCHSAAELTPYSSNRRDARSIQ